MAWGNTAWAHSNPKIKKAIKSGTGGLGGYSTVSRNYISGGRTTGNLTGNEREAWHYYTSPEGQGQSLTGGTFDPKGWTGFRTSVLDKSGNFLPAPTGVPGGGPGGGGSGGGGFGGGGGGGGSAITQAMIDAMGRVLGAQGPQMNLTPFQGQELGAFNAQPYQQATQQVQTAQAADLANIGTNEQATQQALNQTYSNPYATAQVNPGVPMQQPGQALANTVGGQGGGGAQQATQATNADNANSQAAFQNLLQVLAGASQQSQQSRQMQVGMDANYGRQGVNAQASGLGAGIQNAQAQASNQWGQAQQERQYQNSLMAQQWQRQQEQANYEQQQQQRQQALQPILQLIQQSAGTPGLNFNSLFQALGIAA